MNRYSALVIGLGNIGVGYDANMLFKHDNPQSSLRVLTHARSLACHPGFFIQAGIDPMKEARQRFEEIYCAPSYADIQNWILKNRNINPDLVIVSAGAKLQPKIVKEILENITPKILLLEKPVAHCLEEGEQLYALCRKYPQTKAVVNYIRSWLPAVQHWRYRIESGELGNLIHGQLTYGKGLLNNGSHFVNLAQTWLGPLRYGKTLDRGESIQNFDREISCELLSTNHDDAPLQVRSVGNSGLRAGELDLWFEQGRLCWPNHGQKIVFWPRGTPDEGDSHVPLTNEAQHTETRISYYQLEVVEAMYRQLENPDQTPLRCCLKDGLDTLRTLAPAYDDEL